MMPVWFGIGFVGPVMAEIILRTALYEILDMETSTETVYIGCMALGGLYGVFAWRSGRWL